MSRAIHSLTKCFLLLFAAFCLVSLLPTPSQSAIIFQSGWERNPGDGCTAPPGEVDLHIVDRATVDDSAGFDYDHSINPCALVNGYPAMATVTSPVHSGIHSFRYHCPKNFSGVNGRGGVIPKTFSATYPELYIRYYVRWDSNFRFVDYDYKSTFAMMTTGQHTYNSYYGDGSLTTGRLRFFWWGGASVAPYSTNITLRRDTWHCMEWHLRYGAAGLGYAEAKVDGTLVQWTDGYGTKIYIESADSPYLGRFSGFRLDNTINGYYDGSFQDAIPADAFIYYDDVKINNGDGWIGCAKNPPRPPTGLRVIP